MTNSMMIAAQDAHTSLKSASPASIEEAIPIAFAAVRHHWLVTNEDEQFQSGLAGLLMHYAEGTEERRRLDAEALAIKRASALFTAADAGLTVEFPEPDHDPPAPLRLLAAWWEPSE